jgi:hypothetical protein
MSYNAEVGVLRTIRPPLSFYNHILMLRQGFTAIPASASLMNIAGLGLISAVVEVSGP